MWVSYARKIGLPLPGIGKLSSATLAQLLKILMTGSNRTSEKSSFCMYDRPAKPNLEQFRLTRVTKEGCESDLKSLGEKSRKPAYSYD